MKKEVNKINITKPSLLDIDMMYQIIIIKYPKVINNYKEASILINKEFNTELDQYQIEQSQDITLDIDIEDQKLIYSRIK